MKAKSQAHVAFRSGLPRKEKRRIVELALRPGASLKAVAQECGVHPGTLSYWKRCYRNGDWETLPNAGTSTTCASAFLPITVASALAQPYSARDRSRIHIRIETPSGISFSIDAQTDDFTSLTQLFAHFSR